MNDQLARGTRCACHFFVPSMMLCLLGGLSQGFQFRTTGASLKRGRFGQVLPNSLQGIDADNRLRAQLLDMLDQLAQGIAVTDDHQTTSLTDMWHEHVMPAQLRKGYRSDRRRDR